MIAGTRYNFDQGKKDIFSIIFAEGSAPIKEEKCVKEFIRTRM